ncbi:MAG TPA: TonB-dependent receptor plug domain-containing protein [Gemmatimonadaceae bacterium]|nr:TonB-dependent receptor plug domain-containing protein [Gemmatimonadaceae bacterium]
MRPGLVWGVLFASAAHAAPHVLHAQVVPPPASEVPVPPSPRTEDTTAVAADTVQRDTIQPPIGRAAVPRPPSLAPAYVWEGDEILASGAYTLTDLLRRVPEITTFRSGWLHSPQYAAVMGNVTKIRVFIDGIQLETLDPRESGFHELGRIPIWSLQRVAVERAGTEIRVDLRTWTVDRTNPYTRTDVYTGTEETDIYRGYYGKRFNNGAIFQAGGEQQASENRRTGGGGDALSVLARAGVGRRNWSLDAFAERRRQSRVEQATSGTGQPLPPWDATHTVAYVRAAAGRQSGGPWLELLAASQAAKESSPHDAGRIPADTVDTSVSRAQYVASAGYRTGPVSVGVTGRLRRFEKTSRNSITGRGEFMTDLLQVAGQAEGGSGYNSFDAHARLQPIRFIAILASGSRRTVDAEAGPQDSRSTSAFRLEAGLNLGGIWAYGGTLSLDDVTPPVNPLDPGGAVTLIPLVEVRQTATFGGLRGRGWRGFGADTYVIRWKDPGLYMPEYQARAELNFHTRWLSRFPRGEFEFSFAAADEFRSGVNFLADRVGASHTLWGLMEIRIQRATLTVQVWNPLGRQYFLVPGFEMPRAVSTYGIRWHFWG